MISALNGVEGVVFIGGTALNRTHLPDVRLSEDLDIHLLEGEADGLVDRLLDAVRLEFPGIRAASKSRREEVVTYVIGVDELRVQIQTVGRRPEWVKLPAKSTPVRLKYPDLPDSVDLTIPTVQAFGAMKLAAYIERRAARDLFDLKELVERRALSDESIALTRDLLGRSLAKQEFDSYPTDDQWRLELSHQVADPGRPAEAVDTVCRVLAELSGWERPNR